MLKKLSIVAIVGLLGIMAGGVTIAASAGDDSAKGKVIRLDEKTTDFAYVANDPAGPLGDFLVFHADLFNRHGEKVGIDGGTCVFTSAAGASQCVATLSFAKGDITTQGLNTDPDIPFEAVFAITGGTGAFTGVAGELEVEQVSEELAHLTLRLTRPASLTDD
jgi:hypothetical protein